MKNTQNPTYVRARKALDSNGWTILRQFAPKKADAIGDERFEMWMKLRDKGEANNVVVVHFYADNAGCEFYMNGVGQVWADVDKILAQ